MHFHPLHSSWWSGLMLVLSLSANAGQHAPIGDYPSAELLEFLAEFGDADEQTLELIEFHALQDEQNKARENTHEE